MTASKATHSYTFKFGYKMKPADLKYETAGWMKYLIFTYHF